VIAFLDVLPGDHPYHRLLPRAECYHVPGAGAVLVLGPPASASALGLYPRRPRIWYSAATVAELTRAWRAVQRETPRT
jgi:hypothetical protein